MLRTPIQVEKMVTGRKYNDGVIITIFHQKKEKKEAHKYSTTGFASKATSI